MDKIKIALNMGTNLFETVNFYYKEENFLYNCASAFKELRKQEKFCDIETTTKNRKITAHRVILAAVAPRFFNEICTKNVFKTENIVYQLDIIKEACMKFITSNLAPENVLKFKQVADLIKCQTLINSTNKFICDNFTDVVSLQHFVKLEFKELLDIIGKDDLKLLAE